ncbi:MAG: hypothetical protein H6Q68_190 [Firmicutes bacterium]|nr:hypothetical protein [Bacillota bacterium]
MYNQRHSCLIESFASLHNNQGYKQGTDLVQDCRNFLDLVEKKHRRIGLIILVEEGDRYERSYMVK